MGKGGLIALLALAACATPPAQQASNQEAPRTIEQAQVSPANPTPSTVDTCKAGELQWLVGRNKSEIPVPVDPSSRRVTCTTCPVTEDFRPNRLNIFFNERTEIVEQVRCG